MAAWPVYPKECGHAACELWTRRCCACSDKRPVARDGLYEAYVDGHGFQLSVGRSFGYCPSCSRAGGAAVAAPAAGGGGGGGGGGARGGAAAAPAAAPPAPSRGRDGIGNGAAAAAAAARQQLEEARHGESDEDFARRLGGLNVGPALPAARAAAPEVASAAAVAPAPAPARAAAVAAAAAAGAGAGVAPRSVSAAALGATLEEDLSCAVCIGVLNVPVTTPCGHSFCRACLVELCKGRGDKISCPMCRTTLATAAMLATAPSVALARVLATLARR